MNNSKSINLPLTCFLILFTTLAIAGVGGMSVVTLRQQIADSARRLQTSEGETTRLERLSEELRAKIAMLENPAALKMVAQRMGMQPARLDQYRLMGAPVPTQAQEPKNVASNIGHAKKAKGTGSYAKDF